MIPSMVSPCSNSLNESVDASLGITDKAMLEIVSCVGGVVVISGMPPECSGTKLTVPVDVGKAIDVTGIAKEKDGNSMTKYTTMKWKSAYWLWSDFELLLGNFWVNMLVLRQL